MSLIIFDCEDPYTCTVIWILEVKRDGIVVLKAGDYYNIDAHVQHRVEWSDPLCGIIWLAVHY